MTTRAPTLAELQAEFQDAILSGGEDILRLIPANTRTGNEVLFGVYRHAYVARLQEVVANAYPLLRQYMGDAEFSNMSRHYVAEYPSRTPNARWYAGAVPELLGRASFVGRPELRELAMIERELDLAFDAPDGPLLDINGLAAFPPETWGDLVFVPHPSTALLSLETNAFELWLALKNEGDVPRAQSLAEPPQTYLVWRRASTPAIRRLEGEERILWLELTRGKTFSALAEIAATLDEPETAALRVAQHLNGWLSAGLLSAAMT